MPCVRLRRGKWWADYYDATGKRHREARETKKEAEQVLAERQVQIARGSYRGDGRKVTLEKFAQEWLIAKAERWAPSTFDCNRIAVEKYLCHPQIGLGRIKVGALDLRAVEAFKAAIMQTFSNRKPRTLNLALTVLGQVLTHAVRHGLRSDNPVAYCDKHKLQRHEVEPLSPAEIGELLKAARSLNPMAYCVIHTALYTGMRLGELLALQWMDFNEGSKTLHVRGTNSHREYRNRFRETGRFSETKTASSRRKVLLCAESVRELRAYRLRTGRPPESQVIFANRQGGPMDPHNFRQRHFEAALKAAKLLVEDGGRRQGFRFHDLRHTYASRMLAEGVAVEFVSRQLGHSNPMTTLSVYRHWIPDRDSLHVETVQAALAGTGH